MRGILYHQKQIKDALAKKLSNSFFTVSWFSISFANIIKVKQIFKFFFYYFDEFLRMNLDLIN